MLEATTQFVSKRISVPPDPKTHYANIHGNCKLKMKWFSICVTANSCLSPRKRIYRVLSKTTGLISPWKNTFHFVRFQGLPFDRWLSECERVAMALGCKGAPLSSSPRGLRLRRCASVCVLGCWSGSGVIFLLYIELNHSGWLGGMPCSVFRLNLLWGLLESRWSACYNFSEKFWT